MCGNSSVSSHLGRSGFTEHTSTLIASIPHFVGTYILIRLETDIRASSFAKAIGDVAG